MHTLTTSQMLALLCAVPVDHSRGVDLRHDARGLVTSFERYQALRLAKEGSAPGCEATDERWMRVTLARVFGLPAREPGVVEPIVMSLAWASETKGDDEHRREWVRSRPRIDAALDRCGTWDDRISRVARVEALVAEVLELRRVTATTIDNALERLRAEIGPESERAIVEHVLDERTAEMPCLDAATMAEHETIAAAVSCSYDVPARPLYYCAGPSCPGYPYAASSLAHPASCNEVKP